MTSTLTTSSARPFRAFAVVPLALMLSFCAGRSEIRTTADPRGGEIGQLWVEPHDLEARDLFHGAGGPGGVPDTSAPYELIAVDDSGYSPGYDVRDREGVVWSVKLGSEAQPEVVVSRVLWAIGYHQPPAYLVQEWRLSGGTESGPQGLARFRRGDMDQKVVADWSWYENPFAHTVPFKGLMVANLILNNWDWKTSNNKVYERSDGDGGVRSVYVVRDLGASLGKTSFPKFLTWTPLRGMGQGSRNDLEGFEAQALIKSVEGQRVRFDYRGIHSRLVNTLTVDDVLWACRLMNRLSDEQWRDAFRAGGYDETHQQRYVAKVKSKIAEGLALRTSAL